MRSLYSIFDRGVGKFNIPFPAETDHDAIRQCKAVVNSDRKSPITDYPEDFDLYQVGKFNEESGTLIPFEANSIRFVIKLIDLKELKTNA